MYKLMGLPLIDDTSSLSKLLNISSSTLFLLSNNAEKYYKRVEIPKSNGKKRILACPSYKIKAVQAYILREILNKIPIDKHATGYTNLNLRENAQRHQGNKYVLCMDIENFFPETKKSKIFGFFQSIGYNIQVTTFFTKICTYQGGLPQGGVTSPALSNILNIQLDGDIFEYCSKKGLTYSRYADDITISSNNKKVLNSSVAYIKQIIEKHDYKVNNDKTRILQPGMQRKITGLIYNDQNDIRIGTKKKKIIRAKIHHYVSSHLNPEEKELLYAHLMGWMAFLYSVDRKTYAQLEKYWNKLSDGGSNSQIAVTREEDGT